MMFPILLLASALGADYNHTADMEVALNPPPASRGKVGTTKIIGEITIPANLPDTVITSTWTPLTCEIQDNILSLNVSGNNSTWPTALPASGTATCSATYSGYSYALSINLTQAANVPWNTGFEGFEDGFTLKGKSGHTVAVQLLLPNNGTYETGAYPALLAPGQEWSGMWCKVSEDLGVSGRYWLYVTALSAATTNQGGCRIFRVGDLLVGTVPIDFERI